MEYRLSPWHDGSVKPVHIGVYESQYDGFYRKWNGEVWLCGSSDFTIAKKEKHQTCFQNSKWRGIIK